MCAIWFIKLEMSAVVTVDWNRVVMIIPNSLPVPEVMAKSIIFKYFEDQLHRIILQSVERVFEFISCRLR